MSPASLERQCPRERTLPLKYVTADSANLVAVYVQCYGVQFLHLIPLYMYMYMYTYHSTCTLYIQCTTIDLDHCIIHVLMRDEKEGRKMQQERSNKQTKQHSTLYIHVHVHMLRELFI